MVSRRTSAVVELVVALVGLLFQLRIWQYLREHGGRDDSISLSLYGLSMGAIGQIAQYWLKDNDYHQIRSNRRREFVASFCFIVWERVLRRRTSNPRAVRYNFGVGRTAGAVLYRLWYGLLHPLPGPNE